MITVDGQSCQSWSIMIKPDNHMLTRPAVAALNQQFRREVLNVMTGVPRGLNGQDSIPPLRNVRGGSSDGDHGA